MARLWIGEGYNKCWICQNKPEYALIMLNVSGYALITLNMIEYADVYLKNIVLNMLELFWICLMQYIA